MAQNIKVFSIGTSKIRRIYLFFETRRTRFIRCCCRDIADLSCGISDSVDLGISERMAAGIMGTNHRKSRRHFIRGNSRFTGLRSKLCKDTTGDAVVEATILFPIMIMIFAALVLLAIYLPARAVLQRATQYAATAIATESSDTWLFFNEGSMSYYRETSKKSLKNVYAELFTAIGSVQSKGEAIVINVESQGISSKAGNLDVNSNIVNRIFYKEAVVTATREFPMPVDLSFIGFPQMIEVTATSSAVVQNGDEFVRNMDIANDFAEFISERYGLSSITDAISSFGSRVSGILGW